MPTKPETRDAYIKICDLTHSDDTKRNQAWSDWFESQDGKSLRSCVNILAYKYHFDEDETEDLWQDTIWLLFYQTWRGKYEPDKGAFVFYAKGIARNCAKKILEHRTRTLGIGCTEDVDETKLTTENTSTDNPFLFAENQMLWDQVQKMVKPIDWIILNRIYRQGWSERETALEIHMKVGAVRKRLERCLKRLRQTLSDQYRI